MVVKRRAKPLLIALIAIAVLVVALIVTAIVTWNVMMSPVNKNNNKEIEVVIKNGSTSKQIATVLKEKELIRSEFFFRVYLKISNTNYLKASTYKMKQSMPLKEIVTMLEKGNSYNPDEIKITFKEGERITDFAKVIAKNTENDYETVINTINNKEYLNTLITKYWFLTDSILQSGIYYPLEGYLAPNTYHFRNSKVKVEEIIEKMLEQTSTILNKYKNQISTDPHHYITMASMAELEGTNTNNRKDIVAVFNNRLQRGMSLGSDVTTYYALQHPMNQDLTTEQFNTVNPYNTRSSTMAGKMPIGPICNPSDSSLEAAINPNTNDYIYFVADKHGKIYFTKTLQEHNAKVAEIKKKGDWIW